MSRRPAANLTYCGPSAIIVASTMRVHSEQALSSHYLFDAIWLKVRGLYLLGTVQRDEAHGESCDLPMLLLSVLVPPADERDGISLMEC